MSNMINGKISVILASTMLAITGGTLSASAIVSNTIGQQIGGQQGKSQTVPTTSLSGSKFQIAQTAAGYCVVSVQPGRLLNVRQQPSTRSKVLRLLKNGTKVALGVTDGSEGKNWTRIISPIDGYVTIANLKNCRTRG